MRDYMTRFKRKITEHKPSGVHCNEPTNGQCNRCLISVINLNSVFCRGRSCVVTPDGVVPAIDERWNWPGGWLEGMNFIGCIRHYRPASVSAWTDGHSVHSWFIRASRTTELHVVVTHWSTNRLRRARNVLSKTTADISMDGL